MPGDDSNGQMADRPISDLVNPSPHRRHSHMQPTHPRHHPSQSSGHGRFLSSPISSSQNVHQHPPAGLQGPSLSYASVPVPYAQRPSYGGQYATFHHPAPKTTAPYAFPHTYHFPAVPESSAELQSAHTNYQLQHHAPIYSYQSPSPEGGSSSHPTFSLYPLYQSSSSTAPTSPHMASTSSQSSPVSTSFVGPGLPSIHYPSLMSPTPYLYPTQSYQASPMYQSQYHPPYGQHSPAAVGAEPQGTWHYIPHSNPTSSPDGVQPYYSPVDGSYFPGPSLSTASPSAHADFASPSSQRLSQHAME
ncbi:unnamed protein product [Cyclocybe aegerita]|uniref:Uncharacterized protein n=1 Tax=Cyclocybe aegerita TaxID=1973307 RepID=A0A8S0XZQ4_CYCAE|nr:unnamed protein product [Cyclocybe aegerita]